MTEQTTYIGRLVETFTAAEKAVLSGAINTVGDGQHPMAEPDASLSAFSVAYAATTLRKMGRYLNPKGRDIAASLLAKLGETQTQVKG